MKISFDCDDPEVMVLVLKAILLHLQDNVEREAMCKQLELSIEMAKAKNKASKPYYTEAKEHQDPNDIWADQ
jgi:hypothetical protein